MCIEKINLKKVLRISGNILVIISIIFLFTKVVNMDIDYKDVFSVDNVVRLIPILILYTLQVLLSYIPWQMIITCMIEKSVPSTQVCCVFAKANIMKYIPGNIFQYVGRAELAQLNSDVNITLIATSVIIETIATALAAILVGIVGATEYTISLLRENKSICLLIVIFIVVVFLIVLVLKDRIREFLGKKNVVINGRLVFWLLIAVIFYMGMLIFDGIMLTYIMQVISGQNYFKQVQIICGAFAISWVAGYIMPGASGGVGIREAILFMLLGNSVEMEAVILATLILRFVNILADLQAYGITLLMKKLWKK